MKKNLFVKVLAVLLFCAAFSAGVNAQNTFSKNDKVVNLGIGLGTGYGLFGYKMAVPPVSGSFEYGIIDNLFNDKSSLGIGGYFGYVSYKHKYTDWDYRYSNTIIGLRGALHYQLVDKLDTYGGVMIGYRIWSGSSETTGHSSLSPDLFVGARYYLLDNLSGFAELGFGGIAYLQLGVSFKF